MSGEIQIWEPRYKDNKVLIATYKVARGVNRVIFTKAKHLIGKVFEVDGDDVFHCPIQRNGRTCVYVVPMEKLKLL